MMRKRQKMDHQYPRKNYQEEETKPGQSTASERLSRRRNKNWIINTIGKTNKRKKQKLDNQQYRKDYQEKETKLGPSTPSERL